MSGAAPKTQYYTASTLDGFIAGPDDSLDWLMQFGVEGTSDYPDFIRQVGAVELVGQFHDRGLLDELIVTIAPVTLGAGKPLLPRAITTPPLELLSSEVYGPFVQLRYTVGRRA